MRSTYSKALRLYFPIVFTTLFLRDFVVKKTAEENDLYNEENHLNRIRCPHCRWQPGKFSRWHCVSGGFPEFYMTGCGTVWNTFETRGKCPGCAHQWRWTACLSCHQDSLHEDWYSNEA